MTSVAQTRQHVGRDALQRRDVPVERIEDHVLDATERLDLAADPVHQRVGLAEEVELLPVVEVHAREDTELRGGTVR